MTKYIRIIKKQNTCKVTFDLSIAVKVTIILFLCGLLNCIKSDLFMNTALYKCCIVTHHSLHCIAQRSIGVLRGAKSPPPPPPLKLVKEATRLLGGSGACSPEKIFKNGAIWCVLESILLKFCQKNILKNSHFL